MLIKIRTLWIVINLNNASFNQLHTYKLLLLFDTKLF